MNARFALGFLLVLASTPACATLQIARPGTLQLATAQVAPDQRISVYNRAITALIEEGFIPQTFDDATCFVVGKRRDDLGTDILSGALAVVQVTPDGQVRVQVSGVGIFSNQDALNAEIQHRQEDILKHITRS